MADQYPPTRCSPTATLVSRKAAIAPDMPESLTQEVLE
jgi:hypothetical protein